MTSNYPPFFYPETGTFKPPIAISACLAGEAVRYDGASKPLSDNDFFESHFQLHRICPEVGAGLSVPRPPVELVQTQQGLRALGRDDRSLDISNALLDYREQSLADLSAQSICGYIFKSRSPSCGIASTPLFNEQGEQVGLDSGLQASYFQQKMPWLVFREETQLNNDDDRRFFLWLCRISRECQQAIERNELSSFRRHYQARLTSLDKLPTDLTPSSYRQKLIVTLDNRHK